MERRAIELPSTEAGDVEGAELTFIGTATVLLRYGGFTLLTDPNFLHRGDHAKLGYGLRSRRLTAPAMTIAELPPLDFIVLSHHHGDHFDEVAAAQLDKRLPIVTTDHASRKLRGQGFAAAVALDTWESQLFVRGDASVRVTAMPGKHGPGALAALLPPVMGSMVEFAEAGRTTLRLYITGDTLVHDRLGEIPRRYPEIDLGLIHLGGTRVLGVLVTMDAEQGMAALRLIRPRTAVPIHYGDYTVFKEPLAVFEEAVSRSSLPTVIRTLGRGETYRFDPARLAERDTGPAQDS
ncbi:MAG: MBL fold metallo-hydrolase [Actinobacteria bacterium]|nr:MBL fold metallo-hydrolase [Actinomycetota bacterium]